MSAGNTAAQKKAAYGAACSEAEEGEDDAATRQKKQ